MSSYVGPNGRIYQRKSNRAKWVTLTVLSMLVITAVMVGVPHVMDTLHYASIR
jgi:hypothetical protein